MDWVALLEDNHIPFVTRGPNTRRGEISVKCPWCGDDDPSEHLGISTEREVWGCHRNPQHRGKRPHRLLQALLGVSNNQAQLVVAQYGAADPEALDQALTALDKAPEGGDLSYEKPVTPPEFRAIKGGDRFYRYLEQRGFDDPLKLASIYNIQCCNTGRWKDRIIIPVYRNNELVAWTGRALQKPVNAPRYLSTSDVIKTVIMNEDALAKGGECLFVTEGPFDFLKVDYYGYPEARATAVFGTSVTIDQISILRKLSKKFHKTILLFDANATDVAFSMAEWIPGSVIGNLPDGVDDPGDLSESQVKSLINQILN
jgi:hypothetical protein